MTGNCRHGRVRGATRPVLSWAHSLAERIGEPLLTCEAFLAEAAFHLQDTALVLRMMETGSAEKETAAARVACGLLNF